MGAFDGEHWTRVQMRLRIAELTAALKSAEAKTFDAVASYSKRLADEQTLHRETQRQLDEARALVDVIAASEPEDLVGSLKVHRASPRSQWLLDAARALAAKESGR